MRARSCKGRAVCLHVGGSWAAAAGRIALRLHPALMVWPLPLPHHTCSSLPGLALSGTLPEALNLPELQVLDLKNNQLDGPLPSTLQLRALQVRAGRRG